MRIFILSLLIGCGAAAEVELDSPPEQESALSDWDADPANVNSTPVRPLRVGSPRFLWKRTIGAGSSISDNEGYAISPGAETETQTYYQKTGFTHATGDDVPFAATYTYDQYLTDRKYLRPSNGESRDHFMARAKWTAYYNRFELGLGRALGCTTSADYDLDTGARLLEPRVDCSVENYGEGIEQSSNSNGWAALTDAIAGTHMRNAVVITYRPALVKKYGRGYGVQFGTFGSNGVVKLTAQLDYGAGAVNKAMGSMRPNRPHPQICINCHGGVYDASKHLVRDAKFLPPNVGQLQFAYNAPFNRASQEEAFRYVTDLAYRADMAHEENPSDPFKDTRNAMLSYAQKKWIRAAYGTGVGGGGTGNPLPDNAKFIPLNRRWQDVPPQEWKGQELDGFADYNVASEDFYLYTLMPACGGCHLALDTRDAMGNSDPVIGDTDPARLNFMRSYAAFTATNIIGDSSAQRNPFTGEDEARSGNAAFTNCNESNWAQAAAILSSNCAGCHSGAPGTDRGAAHNWTSQSEVQAYAAMIRDRITRGPHYPGHMPPSGAVIADSALITYLNCYASPGWKNANGSDGRITTAIKNFEMPASQIGLQAFWKAAITQDGSMSNGTLSGARWNSWSSRVNGPTLQPFINRYDGKPFGSGASLVIAMRGQSIPTRGDGCFESNTARDSFCGEPANSGRFCASNHACAEGCGNPNGTFIGCPGSDGGQGPNREQCLSSGGALLTSGVGLGVLGSCQVCGGLGQARCKCGQAGEPACPTDVTLGCSFGLLAFNGVCGCSANSQCAAIASPALNRANVCDLNDHRCYGCAAGAAGCVSYTNPSTGFVTREYVSYEDGFGISNWSEDPSGRMSDPPTLFVYGQYEDRFPGPSLSPNDRWYRVAAPAIGQKLEAVVETQGNAGSMLELQWWSPWESNYRASTADNDTRGASVGSSLACFNDSTVASTTTYNVQSLAVIGTAGQAPYYYLRVRNIWGVTQGNWGGYFNVKMQLQNQQSSINMTNSAYNPYYSGAVDGSEPTGVWIRVKAQAGSAWTKLRLVPFGVGTGTLGMDVYGSDINSNYQKADLGNRLNASTGTTFSTACAGTSCDYLWVNVRRTSASGYKEFTLQAGDPWSNPAYTNAATAD